MAIRHRIPLLGAVLALALAASGTAYAFDCVRVSSSAKGLQQSARSGNWLPFDLSSAAAVKETFANIGSPLSDAQAACFAREYAASGQPLYFALGIGVAGAERSRDGAGVLAWHNKNSATLSDGRGIDHIEGAILGAVFAAAQTCGIPLDEE